MVMADRPLYVLDVPYICSERFIIAEEYNWLLSVIGNPTKCNDWSIRSHGKATDFINVATNSLI